MATNVPPGWPAGVHPPASPGFPGSATAWLLDVVPPDYRLHGVLVRHPVALACLARHHLTACVDGARRGYRGARSELRGQLPPAALDAVLEAYRSEGHRLAQTAAAAALIEGALRGERFVPRLDGAARPRAGAGPGAAASGDPVKARPRPQPRTGQAGSMDRRADRAQSRSG